MIDVGRRVEIAPAFNHATHALDIFDEIAGCFGVVRAHGREGSGEHLVEMLDGEEHWIYVTRLRER